MFKLFCSTFIRDYKNVEDTGARERYGTAFSIFSIVCNVIIVVFKLIISFITFSVSIRADAFNNLSDIGSNLATLFGFRLSNKHPDKEHPYGHGRMEYIAGMVVAFLILLMGFEAIKESVMKIIEPYPIVFTGIAVAVMVFSILVKLLMAYMNNNAGETINSPTLKAAGQDSLNDCLTTGATLLSFIIFKLTGFNSDAYVGVAVSAIVLISGVKIFKAVLTTILGKAPDRKLIKDIEKDICQHDGIIGVHDLMMHDYGPSQRYVVLHAEVDASIPIMSIHETIDDIENMIQNKYNVFATIHMDPVDTKDKLARKMRKKVEEIVSDINPEYHTHDLRIVRGANYTKIVFDVEIPANDKRDHEELIKLIDNKVKEIDKDYTTVIQIDHPYI